ncbi:MAG: DNA methyltransferase [Gammaproteobacteria bacterium CG11_big_fil_rev_8_21_14_0_20_46_22]|nr:MAG: DNA methyltransferase [Gammaproteobacteria bacterium CG12_big_fil_rev_8_21_14_0_65_46_12]PIR11060.1 MAG: DNA methyltransferase [Gammaproteobacteria bacterium CG11_big_fil_rev_8_21_14_0_20_46_22]
MKNVPHVIPYQGSKRNLAKRICTLMPKSVNTFYEPFAGSAAVTIYAASNNLAKQYVIADSLEPLAKLWEEIINHPEKTGRRYEEIWKGYAESPDYFLKIRERFNAEKDPVDLLYLVARCVKNAVRFNRNGDFTQSADKRRLGTRPERMKKSINEVSQLLKGRVIVRCGDFRDSIKDAKLGDLVYMDPPYHGTTYGRDKRYFMQLGRDALIEGLEFINNRDVPFILSYDGKTGNVEYADELPEYLKMKRLWIAAGRSSQATLSGRSEETIESLYISRQLLHYADSWCQKGGVI